MAILLVRDSLIRIDLSLGEKRVVADAYYIAYRPFIVRSPFDSSKDSWVKSNRQEFCHSMASFLIKESVMSELEFGMSSIQKGLLHCPCGSSCTI
ncbi:hypothetical protein NC652_028478 [Populus alba x Populus x berolinensis]|nr:hypothetical protein NC652_028478 [Populus alba x Populus x berolinensis]